MAQDATGTPTAKGIPKYNTATDAPSGKGFNAAMDVIDGLITPDAILDTVVDAKGDILAASAADTIVRVAVGANGTILTADTAETAGLKWTTPTGIPVGTIVPTAVITLPSGYLACDGAAVSKTTFADLWAALNTVKGTFTVTIASPAVVTLNSHGFSGGERVFLTTTGALPTGLTVDTDYFVIAVDANTFRLATSVTNYLSSTAINTSGTQSGTHTLTYAPYGVSGSTNFKTPDLLGRVPVGDSAGGAALVKTMGLHDDRASNIRSINHRHGITTGDSGAQGGVGENNTTGIQSTVTSGDANNTDYPAFLSVRFMIKT